MHPATEPNFNTDMTSMLMQKTINEETTAVVMNEF